MVGVRSIVLLVCYGSDWRVYDSSDSFRVVQSVVRVGGDVRQVQGQICIDHI